MIKSSHQWSNVVWGGHVGCCGLAKALRDVDRRGLLLEIGKQFNPIWGAYFNVKYSLSLHAFQFWCASRVDSPCWRPYSVGERSGVVRNSVNADHLHHGCPWRCRGAEAWIFLLGRSMLHH